MPSARELNTNALTLARAELERAEAPESTLKETVERCLFAWSHLDDASRAVEKLDRYRPRTEYEIAGREAAEAELRGAVCALLLRLAGKVEK